MEVLEDKNLTKKVRFTKVYFQNNKFKRFHYTSFNKTLDILWLHSNNDFLTESLENHLEKEFQKILNKNT